MEKRMTGDERTESYADPIGCGAAHGGCGCIGSWDCVHDNKLQRVTECIAAWDQCVAARESGRIPCADDCECRDMAIGVLRAVFPEERR